VAIAKQYINGHALFENISGGWMHVQIREFFHRLNLKPLPFIHTQSNSSPVLCGSMRREKQILRSANPIVH
jgi:hypothetical protein